MLQRKVFTKEEALQKIKHYAAYQERSHQEVKEKLYSFGLRKSDVEELISTLISENYLNEERFATQFAGGKFRINHWGKIKIKYALKQKQVSDYSIRKALAAISDDHYKTTLKNLAEKKWATLKGEHHLTRQAKAQAYLMQKGYEPPLVQNVISSLKSK